MQFKYGNTWAPVRGKTSSGTDYTQYDVTLNDGEYIERITGSHGSVLATMHLYSTAGRDLGIYGGTADGEYGDPNKIVFAFVYGEFCLGYSYHDGVDRFRVLRFNYLYNNT